MIYYFIFGIGTFISMVIFLILFLKEKTKNKNINTEKETANKKIILLSKIIANITNELNSDKKHGFFKETITLLREEDKITGKSGDPYDVNVYVMEEERYNNGLSKVKLEKIEVISGFKQINYKTVIDCVKNKFSSLVETKDVNWLEPIVPITQQRKDKINLIIQNIKEK